MSFRAQMTGRNHKVSGQRVTKRTHALLSSIWNQCVHDFLEDVFRYMLLTHKDTGMSIAAMIPVARMVKVAGLQVFGGGTIGRRKYTGISSGSVQDSVRPFGGRGDKSSSHGKAIGGRQARETTPILYGGPSRMVFQFRFEIPILQWALHEAGVGYGENHPFNGNPLGSMDRGQEAFQATFDREMATVGPKLAGFFIDELSGVFTT